MSHLTTLSREKITGVTSIVYYSVLHSLVFTFNREYLRLIHYKKLVLFRRTCSTCIDLVVTACLQWRTGQLVRDQAVDSGQFGPSGQCAMVIVVTVNRVVIGRVLLMTSVLDNASRLVAVHLTTAKVILILYTFANQGRF